MERFLVNPIISVSGSSAYRNFLHNVPGEINYDQFLSQETNADVKRSWTNHFKHACFNFRADNISVFLSQLQ